LDDVVPKSLAILGDIELCPNVVIVAVDPVEGVCPPPVELTAEYQFPGRVLSSTSSATEDPDFR